MESPYLPQELIDIIISYIDDKYTLASVRLVSSPCRRRADPLYFKKLLIILKYVEEIHWADIELPLRLQDELEAFQETFKERFAGHSHQSVLELHKRYQHMIIDQENAFSSLYTYGKQLNFESFVNIKTVTVDNGCESRTEKYPAVSDAQELIMRPSQWGTIRQSRRGLYPYILKQLAASPTSRTITHFSLKTNTSQWDYDPALYPPRVEIGGPLYMFKNVQHLDVDICLSEKPSDLQVVTIALLHITNPRRALNLRSLTLKTHPHAVDGKGTLGKRLADPQDAIFIRPSFHLLGDMLYPQLRHLEIHCFTIGHPTILRCLDTLQNSLRSLVFSYCVFQPSLLETFTRIREKRLVLPEVIFKCSKDGTCQPAPEKPSIMSEEVITPYLLWLGMNDSLSLHDWDKQIEKYADQNSLDTVDT
ncbi:hypothetical protein V495_05294 [Pseudogymnoascus sp. VKM F-4514 (FW-929)]|nr:hypothetical protein V495_05294 [Pseudogymnoascus sp. VKM F-4514 (FW-929)]KFY58159.1 hypothetical protein V497_05022 [Pseudogymnoascus sp. VKM F-4516 (FW-969)]